MKNTFKLEFYDLPLSLKPSLHFSTKVSELLLFILFDIYFKQFHKLTRNFPSLLEIHSLGSLDMTEIL